MLLYRIGPEGLYAATDDEERLRFIFADPFERYPAGWEMGVILEAGPVGAMAPVLPGKIVAVGRNYQAHAEELGHAAPDEPILFLKSPSSVIGPSTPIVLPPESDRVEFEGEIALVLRQQLRRADAEQARSAILGVTCACDITARDLQRRDPCFSRAKSFDTFCPLGPAILVEPDLDNLEVVTRINGEEKQRGSVAEMLWDPIELLVYASRMMTLEAGDVVLTGTPAGVGPLVDGDRLEIEVNGVGVLSNPVEKWVQS